MKKFVAISLFFTCIVIECSGSSLSPNKPLLSPKNKHKQKNTNQSAKSPTAQKSNSSSPKNSQETKKETSVEDAALKLDKVARLKLALKLCTFNSEEMNALAITPHTAVQLKQFVENFSPFLDHHMIAGVSAWDPDGESHEDKPERKKCCSRCVIL